MDTKWKNLMGKIKSFFFKINDFQILTCFILVVFTIFNYILMRTEFSLVYYHEYVYEIDFLFWGFICIILLALTTFYISYVVLQRKYKNFTPKSDDFYETWKKTVKKYHICFASLEILTAVSLFLFYIINAYQFERPFMLIFQIFSFCIFFITLRLTFDFFLKKKLNLYILSLTEVNQKNIAAAIRSEQMKVDLISNVSHDLKTPLTSMIGYIDLMKKEDLSNTLMDYTKILSNKAEKLKEMIESLFSLAKTSSGNIQLKMEPVNLNRLVEQIYADMEDQITKSGLEFVTELTALNTELLTDSSYMYRICQNLIENAIKYSAKNTRVFLKTAVEKNDATQTISFAITNTANYRLNFSKEMIVERFSRGDEARTTEGNGLGLAIVSTYTSALGGVFDIDIDCDQFKALLTFETKNVP